jgi:methionyl-tRNA formyltransferase
VLSFHPGDIRKYRGLGPSLAFLNEDEKAGITLQRLNDSVDAGTIVAFDTVDITDSHSLDNVVGRINEKAIDMLPRGIRAIENGDTAIQEPDQLGEYRPTSERTKLRFAIRILLKNITGRLNRRISQYCIETFFPNRRS